MVSGMVMSGMVVSRMSDERSGGLTISTNITAKKNISSTITFKVYNIAGTV